MRKNRTVKVTLTFEAGDEADELELARVIKQNMLATIGEARHNREPHLRHAQPNRSFIAVDDTTIRVAVA